MAGKVLKLTFELSTHQIAEHVFLCFHQSLGNFPASYFYIEGTSKINKWVENCSCSGADTVNPQTMKY